MSDRNERKLIDLLCIYEGYGKVCNLKEELVQHQKRIHRPLKERGKFECIRCDLVCQSELAYLIHEISRSGATVYGRRRECHFCGVECPGPTMSDTLRSVV